MNFIENPILRGFNPDPSIIRVNDDYYIATSTFEWFPGIQIHYSTDLINWYLIKRPLNRVFQLDLRGVPDSCGVWAPCLSYDNGIFYLVYSNVKSFSGAWKDTHNYLITAANINGEWSDPVFLNSRGFDGSLFHDDDGKKWYISMLVDHRKGKTFGGIILQEFDIKLGELTGPVHHIFKGSPLGLTEGPHLYKKDGYYYLLTAEGGTEYGHAASMARSRNITGPYEISPNHPLITSRDHRDYYLQKCGHADLVQTQKGDWIIVFLSARPLSPHGLCILGRETSIETIDWPTNEWPELGSGRSIPRVHIPISGNSRNNVYQVNHRDDFDKDDIDIQFQSLRIPITEDWASLKARNGSLCLYGRESLSSTHEQSLLARRIQSLKMEAATCVYFSPKSFQQMAGLICYYNTVHFHYLNLTANESGQKCLQIISYNNLQQTEALPTSIILDETKSVFLKASLNGADLQFYFASKENEWHEIGPVLDAGILSDDYVRDGGTRYCPAFTGAFVGLCCQDLSGGRIPAYFDWFSYQEYNYDFSELIKKELI